MRHASLRLCIKSLGRENAIRACLPLLCRRRLGHWRRDFRLLPKAETGPISVPLKAGMWNSRGGNGGRHAERCHARISRRGHRLDCESHRLALRNPNGTAIIRVDCINIDTGERWTEYSTVWSLRGPPPVCWGTDATLTVLACVFIPLGAIWLVVVSSSFRKAAAGSGRSNHGSR
jgi:hypothetical protein